MTSLSPCDNADNIVCFQGTEAAGTGKYDKHMEAGVYACAGCNTPLYKSATKFNSGCGWPAFFDGEHLMN